MNRIDYLTDFAIVALALVIGCGEKTKSDDDAQQPDNSACWERSADACGDDCIPLNAADVTSSDGDACSGKPTSICVGEADGDDSCSVWWRDDLNETLVISLSHLPPLAEDGWRLCRGAAGEPPACGCAATQGCPTE